MDKYYSNYKCVRCGRETILITGEVKSTERYGNYIACPHCGSKHLIKTKETDSIKECMEHSTYKRINGAIKQIR